MTSFKSAFVLAFLSFGMVSINPVVGQNTVSTLDFWLTFAELLTGDVLTELSKVELPNLIPNIAIPSLPNIALPNIVIPDISALKVPAPAPAPAPVAPQPVQPNYPYYYYVPNAPAPVAPNSIVLPTTAAPSVTTATQKPDGCQPEKIRIIVVNDCDKPKESSESSESSEEAQVIIPYQKSGRYHFQKPSQY